MTSTILLLGLTAAEAVRVSDQSTGINFVFDYESIGSKPWQKFDEVANSTNPDIIRFPGGSGAELLLDIGDPNTSIRYRTDGSIANVTPMSTFQKYCIDSGTLPEIIIPISTLLSRASYGSRDFDPTQEKALRDFVQIALDQSGSAGIAAFELGNEYESYMTSAEYGRCASTVARIVSEATQSWLEKNPPVGNFSEPKTLIQAWSQSAGGSLTETDLSSRNETVLDQFDLSELEFVDGVVTHIYLKDDSASDQASIAAKAQSAVDLMNQWEGRAGRSLEFVVSEWNVNHNTETRTGLVQAGVVVDMYSEMLRAGIDRADFWSSQYHNTSLASKSGTLLGAGQALSRLWQEIDNLAVLSTVSESAQYGLNVYFEDGKTVIVVTSHSNQIVDLALDTGLPGAWSGRIEVLGVDANATDGIFKSTSGYAYWEDPDAAYTWTITDDLLMKESGRLSILLEPYEVAFVVLEANDSLAADYSPSMILGGISVGTTSESEMRSGFPVQKATRHSDYLKGTELAELIRGLEGNDTLVAGRGNDTLDGGEGRDTVFFSDVISGSVNLNSTTKQTVGRSQHVLLNIENVAMGSGHDLITGNGAANRLSGGNGHDTISGGSGNDTAIGGTGNDLLQGGDGIDTIEFSTVDGARIDLSCTGRQWTGEGYDTISGFENVRGSLGTDTLNGTNSANIILGAAGDDFIDGLGGADIISGDDGNDTLIGGGGDDTIDGGKGFDTTIFNVASNIVVDLAVDGKQNTGLGFDWLHSVEAAISAGGHDFLYGSNSANILTSAGGNDSLDGRSGDDTMDGGYGNDTIQGGEGQDTIVFSGTNAVTIDINISQPQRTGYGWDVIFSIENVTTGSQADQIVGNGDSNLISSSAGNDTINCGAGDDTVNPGAGTDLVDGGLGTDTILFDGAQSVRINLGYVGKQSTGVGTKSLTSLENAESGSGDDFLIGSGLANKLDARDGCDTLLGGEGGDTLVGGRGADLLNGGTGNDFLIGGQGDDVLIGGKGSDHFVFEFQEEGGFDVVRDFEAGSDTIVLNIREADSFWLEASSDGISTLVHFDSSVVEVSGRISSLLTSECFDLLSV